MNLRTITGNSSPGRHLSLTGTPTATLNPGVEQISLYGLLRRNKYIVLIALGVCLLAGVAVSELQTPMYRAEALMEIRGINGNFMKASEYEPTATQGRTADAYIATQIRLLKSEALARSIVESTNLNNNPLYFRTSENVKSLKQFFGMSADIGRATVADTARRLVGSITVTNVGESDLISVKVDAPDAKLAASLSNAIANEYIRRKQEERLNTSLQTGVMLTGQLEDFRLRLRGSEEKLQAYARSAGLLFTDERTMATDEQLRLLQADLEKAENDRADKEAEMHVLSTASPESLPKVMDDGQLRDIESRLNDLRRQLAELSTTLTPKNYKVQTVQDEIAALQTALERQRSRILLRIQNEYSSAVQRETLLRTAYDRQTKVVTNDSAKAVQYNVLKREVDANRDLYGNMLQKVKEASVLSVFQSSTMHLVEAAQAPDDPFQPNFLRNAGFGGLLGILSSILLVLARERSNSTLRRRGQLMGVVEAPELGAIPSAVAPGNRTALALEERSGPGADSFMIEAFNCTATSVVSKSQNCKVFVITSPNPREGKSTVVANLGRALARSGRRGILVDGDLRRPSLHTLFNAPCSPGLTEILKDEASHPEIAVNVKSEGNSSAASLKLIAAGDTHKTDWSILQSPRMESLLEELRQRYDFVLIDSPPMLQLTDARILARLADAVVLVCRAGQTRPEQLREAARLLSVDGALLFGTVLNDWDAQTEDPGYIDSYSYYNKHR